jgi:putative transposase
MAKKWSNKNLPGALHFVTGNVNNRRPIFKHDFTCEAFFTQLVSMHQSIGFKLIAFVLMPDHFHLIVNPRDGKITEWTGALKSLTAKSLVKACPDHWFTKKNNEHQVWQESFKALPLWSNWMIWQKINYIHSNPIRAGLVKSTPDYRWSSFHSFYNQQTDLAVKPYLDWWWPDDVNKLARAMSEWNDELEQKFNEERGQSRPS